MAVAWEAAIDAPLYGGMKPKHDATDEVCEALWLPKLLGVCRFRT